MQQIIQNFYEKNAGIITKNAFLYKEINTRCFDRLEFIKLNPNTMLDLGAGVGFANERLQQKYPESELITLDLAHAALYHNPCKNRVQADAEQLPFPAAVIDFVYSNLMLHWLPDLAVGLTEIKRVLSANGLLLMSCLGIDTFKELRAAFAMLDDQVHLNHFYDMHDIGDGLLKLGFVDPVMDMEMITLEYPDVQTLLFDMKTIYGPCIVENDRSKQYLGKQYFTELENCYRELTGAKKNLPVSVEVIFGHAWNSRDSSAGLGLNEEGEFMVPVSSIKGGRHHEEK